MIDFLNVHLDQKFIDQIDFGSFTELKKEYRLDQKKTTRNLDVVWEARLKSNKPLVFVFHFEAQVKHDIDIVMLGRSLVYHAIVGNEYLRR